MDLPLVGLAALMVLCHMLILFALDPKLASSGLDRLQNLKPRQDAIKVELPARRALTARTLGKKNGSKKNNVLVTPKTAAKKYDPAKPIDPFKAAAAMNRPFKPLQAKPEPQVRKGVVKQPPARPGTAQAARISSSALDKLSRSSRPVQEVAQSSTQVAGAASIPNSPILSKSNVNMQVEVPEGVAADELNEYELMFYGFQKRMMEKYLGSIMLQVREFERKYPHKSLIPDGKHVMTGRVTFDSSGNIKQIKMVRWTQAQGLQDLFEEVLKSMDSVPNPPKQLWNKEGDFVVFYNLTVNNG